MADTPYTGDEGDDALAEGMAVMDGTEDWRDGWRAINKTRDFIAQFYNTVRDWVTATFVPKSDVYSGTGSVFNKIPRYDGTGRLIVATPSAVNHAAPKSYVDNAVAAGGSSSQLESGGNTFGWVGSGWYTNDTVGVDNNLTVGAGHLFVPSSSPAASSYTVAYINGDGRLSRGASAAKYKKFISDLEPLELGNLFAAPFTRFQMRADGITPADDSWRYGYIADTLVGTDMEPFVVTLDGEVESIDFIGLLLAQVAQLHARLSALESGGE